MKYRYQKNLTILLLVLISITALVVCKNKEDKTTNLNDEETVTEVISMALEPMEKVNAATYSKTRITSSSDQILKYIANKVPDDTWLPYDEKKFMDPAKVNAELNNRKSTHKISSGYYIEIPTDYFTSSNSCKAVTEFNFSGLNLGKVTLLPDFSKWPNLKKLYFKNCRITDVSGFTKSSYLKRITYIDLSYNNIKDLDTGIVKDSRFNLRNQHYRNRCSKSRKGK